MPSFHVKKFIRYYPQPSNMVGEDVAYRAARKIGSRMPAHKPNAVEPVDIAGKRHEPEETVSGLGDRSHAARRGAILCPPGGVYVLADVFVRVESVEHTRHQQDEHEIRAQLGHES